MKTFALRFKTPSRALNILVGIMVLLSFIGFIDATYLTIKHFRVEVPPCTITHGCEQVTTSVYSKILGVPVALLGLVYYLTVLVGCIAYIDKKNKSLLGITCLFTGAGLLFSIWFTFVQAVLLRAFCQYCLLSAITSTSLFITAMLALPVLKQTQET